MTQSWQEIAQELGTDVEKSTFLSKLGQKVSMSNREVTIVGVASLFHRAL